MTSIKSADESAKEYNIVKNQKFIEITFILSPKSNVSLNLIFAIQCVFENKILIQFEFPANSCI